MAKAATTDPASLSLIRPGHLARLLDINSSTVWRYIKNGTLPAPRQVGPGVKGWTRADIAELLERRAAPQPATLTKPAPTRSILRVQPLNRRQPSQE
jgi:predicted DNA-binding transcriptional regulator AlpA